MMTQTLAPTTAGRLAGGPDRLAVPTGKAKRDIVNKKRNSHSLCSP